MDADFPQLGTRRSGLAFNPAEIVPAPLPRGKRRLAPGKQASVPYHLRLERPDVGAALGVTWKSYLFLLLVALWVAIDMSG
ncbi:hypothetical protein GCM10023075_35840 [Streptosporangium album]